MSGITLTKDTLEELTGCPMKKLLLLSELDLSGNMIKHMIPGTFSEFKSLKELNISNNMIRIIPDEVAEELSALKSLDISENALANLEFLDKFHSLEELRCDKNGLDISQKLVATFICNNLQKIDGKPIDNLEKTATQYRKLLATITSRIWTEHFDHIDHSTITSDDNSGQIRNELVRLVRNERPSVPGVPTSVKDLLIKIFCNEFMKRLFSDKSIKFSKYRSPVKKIRISIANQVPTIIKSPIKSPHKSEISATNILSSPRRAATSSNNNNNDDNNNNSNESTKNITSPSKVKKVLDFGKSNTSPRTTSKSPQKSSQPNSPEPKLTLTDAVALVEGNMRSPRKIATPEKVIRSPNSKKHIDPVEVKQDFTNIRSSPSPQRTIPRKIPNSCAKIDQNSNFSPRSLNRSARRSNVNTRQSLATPSKAIECIKKLNFNDEVPNKSDKPNKQVEIPDYQPTNFLRCHSGDKNALKEGHTLDDPTDELTNVWCCSMEPDPFNPERTTGVVATCGGCMVCLIDCSTGQVLKRFEQIREQFYCLAWTTLSLNDEPNNILAVSGFNGHLKLIHPRLLVCFGEFGSGRPNRSVVDFYYSSLAFHPVHRTLLFCASSDTTVTLFDIGLPVGPQLTTNIKQIAVFLASPASNISNIFIHQMSGLLIGGTTGGVMLWQLGKNLNSLTDSGTKKRTPSKVLTISERGKERRTVCDGLAAIDDTFFACKFVSHGCIYIYNVNHLDHGPTFKFDWLKTDTVYIGLSCTNRMLLCGSDTGDIWTYDITLLHNHRNNKINCKVLSWPECRIDPNNPNDAKMTDLLDKPTPLVINNITSSPDGRYIVAVTDCNLVCIWKIIC